MKELFERWDRFWSKVEIDRETGCWNWTACVTNGYGQFGIGHGKRVRPHRWLYEQTVGPLSPGLTIDHLCRNKLCVNPNHLEPVSPRVNVLRGDTVVAMNARKTHCKRGHLFDEANTYRDKDGHRQCRACKALWMREHA